VRAFIRVSLRALCVSELYFIISKKALVHYIVLINTGILQECLVRQGSLSQGGNRGKHCYLSGITECVSPVARVD
jgi:hypothetical protein